MKQFNWTKSFKFNLQEQVIFTHLGKRYKGKILQQTRKNGEEEYLVFFNHNANPYPINAVWLFGRSLEYETV